MKLKLLQLSLKPDVNKMANCLCFRHLCHCSRGPIWSPNAAGNFNRVSWV